MWNSWCRYVVLLCCLGLVGLGCQQQAPQIVIEMVPHQGCAPLQVELIANLASSGESQATFHWRIADRVDMQGQRVRHTFASAGVYAVSLTVAADTHTVTRQATLEVGEATLPRLPGLYLQRGCSYHTIPEVTEQQNVEQLGKTSLEDLEQNVVGHTLSTRELLTHPLWRREHTHTLYSIPREQFVKIDLAHFQTHGFAAVDVKAETLLQRLAETGSETTPTTQIVTRKVDSWGLDDVLPMPLRLNSTRVTPTVLRYVPATRLSAGLYLIHVKSGDTGSEQIRPVALVGSQNGP